MAIPDPSLRSSHTSLVTSISAQISAFYAQRTPFRLNHSSTNSTRTGSKGPHILDVSSLSRVLHLDVPGRTVLVEPNVPMDRLVEATLPHGLVPPVVMEFPGITSGGGVAGTSGESSSWREGWFDGSVEWVEVVLGDGEVVRAGLEGERADLWRGMRGALGTLGVVTAVKLRLKPARPFVEVGYRRVGGVGEARSVMEGIMREGAVEYVDGIMYGKGLGAVITGRLVDEPGEGVKPQKFSGRWDPFFHLHVKDKLGEAGMTTDTVPLADYLFRYDRGGFWVAPMAFEYFKLPYNRLLRAFLDDFLHTRMMYTALHGGGAGKEIIIQDLALPMDAVEEFTDYTHDKFGIYPLWLCPLKTDPGPSFHPHLKNRADGGGLMMNVGLWGWGTRPPPGKSQKQHHYELNRDLEAKLKDLGGMKWLYAQTYYEKDEFWRDYVGGKEWYDELREKYRATSLPDVYQKTHTEIDKDWNKPDPWQERLLDVWPIGGLVGIWKAIRSGTYRAARASAWKTIQIPRLQQQIEEKKS